MQEILHELEHILLHPLIETAKMLPILFLAYLFMEWLEAAEGSKMAKAFNKAKKSGQTCIGCTHGKQCSGKCSENAINDQKCNCNHN